MRQLWLLGAALSASCVACVAKPESSPGFRLPDGDPARGQEAFVQLRCYACHRVVGLELPAPVVDPPVPVALGGEIPKAYTGGELMTSIINPSHKIVPGYEPGSVRRGNGSRMANFSEAMTVQQMIDLVAFLRSRYEVVPPSQK